MAEFSNEPPSAGPSSKQEVVLASLADSEANTTPRGPRWTRWLVILATLGLVLGPLLYAWFPKEISRWYVASAIETYRDGDQKGATADLDQALRWDSENSSAYRLRAAWRFDDGDYVGTLEDCNRAVELSPDDSRTYMQRSLALHHLGRHQEAIEDCKKLVKLHRRDSSYNRANMLNQLAYARALGNTELDEALEDVEKALELVGDNAPMLDTRGFIRYLQGDMESAKRDMDAAVEGIEAELRQARDPIRSIDQREFERQLKAVRQSVAVVHYHRALVNDKVGQTDQAEQDRQRVRELGYEPNDKLF